MEFESDPAAEFLSREKEILGELEAEIANNDEVISEPSDDFEMISNELDNNLNENDESFVGMKIESTTNFSKEIPEKIRIWQENQTLLLEKKDKDEKDSIERLRQEGKDELSKWMENNKMNLEKIKASNRVNETTCSINGDDVLSDNEMWKSIYELCEFSQQKIKNGRDTSRMKSIFFQLKQNPLNRTT